MAHSMCSINVITEVRKGIEGQVRWHKTLIPAHEGQGRRISKFQANVVYIVSSSLSWVLGKTVTSVTLSEISNLKKKRRSRGRERRGRRRNRRKSIKVVKGRGDRREEYFCFLFPSADMLVSTTWL